MLQVVEGLRLCRPRPVSPCFCVNIAPVLKYLPCIAYLPPSTLRPGEALPPPVAPLYKDAATIEAENAARSAVDRAAAAKLLAERNQKLQPKAIQDQRDALINQVR